MKYLSTRAATRETVTSSEAILRGLAPDGGLYVPQSFPTLSLTQIEELSRMETYAERAKAILPLYLTDLTAEDVADAVDGAYGTRFDDPAVVPISCIGEEGEYVMELWHGPTLAFKDMALQLLPRLMAKARRVTGFRNKITILVATSGDTGKAALEGFRDVDGVSITVFYPLDGVSGAQKLQMVTTGGSNTNVVAVRGNFDDTQTGVKRIFRDAEACARLNAQGVSLSSANSINWGRLVPQIVYYFHAYAELVASGRIRCGDKINFVVPTGNFGNILAGIYARRMGLPVTKFICASNCNNVLTDFFRTGSYDARRPFHKTVSPSMDILISSNLERLVFELNDRDAARTAEQMKSLAAGGSYLCPEALSLDWMEADYADESQTLEAIGRMFADYGYLMDTHTAVAQSVYDRYVARTGDRTPTVIVSTASAYKFTDAVLTALGEIPSGDEFARWERLSALTGTPVPARIRELKDLPVRHTAVCDKDDMLRFVK